MAEGRVAAGKGSSSVSGGRSRAAVRLFVLANIYGFSLKPFSGTCVLCISPSQEEYLHIGSAIFFRS
jgi:hypothetical protein